MKIQYTYRSFPNCPRATEYSRSREWFGTLWGTGSGAGALFSIIWYVIATFGFFSEYHWEDFLLCLLSVTVLCFLCFYITVCRTNTTDCELNIILLEEQGDISDDELRREIFNKMRNKNRAENLLQIKTYFIWYALILTASTSLIALIKSIYLLLTDDGGLGMLVIATIVLTATLWGGYKLWKIANPSTRLKKISQEKAKTISQPKETKSDDIRFCHKCGKELSDESIFCSSCGTKVR